MGDASQPKIGPFTFQQSLKAIKFVLSSVFTRMQMVWTGLLSKNTESRLSVDVPRSKTSLLGLDYH